MPDLSEILTQLSRAGAAGGAAGGNPFNVGMFSALQDKQSQDLLRIELERQQRQDALDRQRTEGLVEYYRGLALPRVSQPKPTKAEESLDLLRMLVMLFGHDKALDMLKQAAPAAGGLGIKPEKPEEPKSVDISPSASMLTEPFPFTRELDVAPNFPVPEHLLPFDPRNFPNAPPQGRKRLQAVRGGEAIPLPFLIPQERPPRVTGSSQGPTGDVTTYLTEFGEEGPTTQIAPVGPIGRPAHPVVNIGLQKMEMEAQINAQAAEYLKDNDTAEKAYNQAKKDGASIEVQNVLLQRWNSELTATRKLAAPSGVRAWSPAPGP